jgi:hypothetical protein
MDFASQSHTSYIPKSPLANNRPSAYTKRNVPILTVVALLVFFAAAALSGGLFVYKKYLGASLEDKKITLDKTRSAFDPALIEELRRLDLRIEHSKKLLANHTAMSILFDILGRATLQNVQYKSFSLSMPEEGVTRIKLSGLARTYASVALQSDSFNTTKGIKNPVFSELSLDNFGNVTFSISADLDFDVFRYSNLLVGFEDMPILDEAVPSIDENQ